MPRRLGPKRASRIRKLFNLSKEDDVRQYVVRKPLNKEGKNIEYSNVSVITDRYGKIMVGQRFSVLPVGLFFLFFFNEAMGQAHVFDPSVRHCGYSWDV